MASAGVHDPSVLPTPQNPGKAKTYNRLKLVIGLLSSGLRFVLLLLLLVFGVSKDLEQLIRSLVANNYAVVVLFAGAVGFLLAMTTLPLQVYSGYVIEHRFQLSNQTFARWVWEHVKGAFVALPFMIGIVAVLYYSLEIYGSLWWVAVGTAVTLLSIVLARLAPIFIMPLFYKFTPLGEGEINERISALCTNAGVRIEGIFTFNLSKNTRKANAGFTGIGKAKRIVLGDTLVKDFTTDEIETVFAHELGHYKHKHILVGIMSGTVATFAGLFLGAQMFDWSLEVFGFSVRTEIAALPLLALWLGLFSMVTGPLSNALSRRHERQADRYAVRTTGKKQSFISALQKLEVTNLADPHPHAAVEWLFYSHPSVGRRIALIQSME